MGFFFGKKKTDPSQPNKDWPWFMNVGGNPPDDVRPYVRPSLEWLTPDGKSFVCLKQTAPHDPERYWYLQCLIAVSGPNEGRYVVDCGYPEEGGPVLLERYYENLEDVFAVFKQALEYEPLDLSDYVKFVRRGDSWQAAGSR